MKPECPIDWKTAFTAALLGFLGAYLIGGYLNMPDAGAIVAIAYVGGRILWYLKRLEARQEPKDTVADAPADTAAADTTPEGSGTEGQRISPDGGGVRACVPAAIGHRKRLYPLSHIAQIIIA